MIAAAATAFGAALLGSGHCAAMCGAFACASADVSREPGARLHASLAYHGGRLVAYVALGTLAGTLGARLDAVPAFEAAVRPAAMAGGGLLIGWGIVRLMRLAGVRMPRLAAPGRIGRIGRAGQAMSAALRRASGWSPRARAAALGGLAPLLPCGWLYAFVASAGATGSAATGAAVMAGFWLGTVPALAFVAIGAHRLLGPARRFVPVLTAVALLAVGAMTLVHGARGEAAPRHAHTAATS